MLEKKAQLSSHEGQAYYNKEKKIHSFTQTKEDHGIKDKKKSRDSVFLCCFFSQKDTKILLNKKPSWAARTASKVAFFPYGIFNYPHGPCRTS